MRGYNTTKKIKTLAVIAAAWSAAPTLVKAQTVVNEGPAPVRTQTLQQTPRFNGGYVGGSAYNYSFGQNSGRATPAFGPTASASWVGSDSFVDATTSFLTGPSWSTASNWSPATVP